ncbi:MAG: arginine--tRNA ligase, partial [Candidatus Nanohaloarchaea archaeon]
MKTFKKKIKNTIEKELNLEISLDDIERPKPEHGDYAYPAMKAASDKNKNPMEYIRKVEVVQPGYVNVYLKRNKYLEEISKIYNKKNLGFEDKKDRILVEFSSPNLAKPMHIGHLRNNVLGDSLQRILDYTGYNVTSENYIGDWGTKHGQVIYAYKKWGSEQEFEENPMEHMYNLYVKLNQQSDE